MIMTHSLTLNKVAAALLGVAMVAGASFAFTATRAHAVTLSELVELFIALDVIPADKAAEARSVLAGQGAETPAATPGATMSCNFTRNLTVGAKGQDVMDLQKLLNLKGYQVSIAGAGSPGQETSFFGPATKAAVSKMQEAFAADILTPLGLSKGTGYFGASTRAKANALCAAVTPTVPTTPTGTTTEPTTPDTTLNGGEATLETLKLLSSPSAILIADNDSDEKVAGFSVKVKNADAAIKRVNVQFEAISGATGFTKSPWKVFDTVTLYNGDTKLADLDVSSESDWNKISGTNRYELSFTGLDSIVRENETANLYVAVSAMNMDTKDEATKWRVYIPVNGVRAHDGANIDQYTPTSAAVTRDFNTEGAGSGEKLKVLLDSSNPKSSIVKVDTNTQTNDVTILVADLQAKDHDIQVSSIPVTLVSASGTIADILSDIKLDVNGTIYNTITPAISDATTTTQFVFDMSDDKLALTKDEIVKAKLIVSLKQQNGNYTAAGETLTASITEGDVDTIDAEGANTITDLSGSAVGETHRLMTTGIFAEEVSKTAAVRSINNGTEDVADFTVKFDVTAFEDTYYVGSTTAAINYTVLKDGAAVVAGTATTSAATTFSDTAESNGNFKITDGATKSITFSATVNPGAGALGYYALRIDSIDYSLTNAAMVDGLNVTTTPADDFKTAQVNLAQ
jgi:peptidoglycan hydrolase-like protein with peptidoglycan-binding domain